MKTPSDTSSSVGDRPLPIRPRWLLTLLLGGVLWASATQARASEAHEAPHHSNHLALFLGGTDGKGDIGVGFTVGVDYERRVNKWLGIVALFDYAARPLEETVLGAG